MAATELPIAFHYKLKNYQQRSYWDCGITSVLMLLNDENAKHFLINFQTILNEEKINKSTWTIDLCYLLKRFNIKHKYLTKTIGINPDFSQNNYYNQIVIWDKRRILDKFRNAKRANIYVEQLSRTLDDKYLIKHLYKYGPIILLINSNLLKCNLCKRKQFYKDFYFCMPWNCNFTKKFNQNGEMLLKNIKFTGHYIVICGYNLNTETYLYKNPAIKDKLCTMTFYDMLEARTSHGTDEDSILIFNN